MYVILDFNTVRFLVKHNLFDKGAQQSVFLGWGSSIGQKGGEQGAHLVGKGFAGGGTDIGKLRQLKGELFDVGSQLPLVAAVFLKGVDAGFISFADALEL